MFNYHRVKLCPRVRFDLFSGRLVRFTTMIRAIRRQSVKRIDYREDPGPQRNRSAVQAVWIAVAVPTLVMRNDNLRGRSQFTRAHQDPVTDLRMFSHLDPFLRSQFPGLEKDPVGDADLTDVMEQRPFVDTLPRAECDAHDFGKMQRIIADSPRMRFGFIDRKSVVQG